MIRTFSFFLLAVFLSEPLAHAQKPVQEGDIQSTVLELVQELGDASADKRDSAERRLQSLGTIALPAVRSIFENQFLEGESQQRLANVLESLQQEALKEFVSERTVTLSGSYSLSQALQNIGDATGNKIELDKNAYSDENPEPKVVVDYQKEPFWRAIDSLADKNQLVVIPYSEKKVLLLQPGRKFGRPRTERAQYNGPFRLEVVSVSASRSFENPSIDGLRATVQVSWEPRMNPLLFEVDKDSLLAECDDGAILESLDDVQLEISPSLATMAEFDVSLNLPPRSSKSIARLTGRITTAIPSQAVPIKFKDLDQKTEKERRVGGIIARIEDTRINGEVIQVDLMLKLVEGDLKLDSFRNWLLVNEAYAIDGEGNVVKNFGWQTYLMNEAEIGITVNFENKGQLKDYQFVFEAPAALINHQIEFVLEDIPLP